MPRFGCVGAPVCLRANERTTQVALICFERFAPGWEEEGAVEAFQFHFGKVGAN